MYAKVFILILLTNCNHSIPKKVTIPKPIINEIIPDFKPIKNDIPIEDKICFDKEDVEALLYNIKMSRIYFNQQTMNLKLVQDYYSKVIADLGEIQE